MYCWQEDWFSPAQYFDIRKQVSSFEEVAVFGGAGSTLTVNEGKAERIGVPNLKVGFNKVFGYYIEITHGNKGVEIPPDYHRKQTTKNAERYVTDTLKQYENEVLTASEKAIDLEFRLFEELRAAIGAGLMAKMLFPTVFRHELLEFAHLATGYLSHTAAPPESWREGP